MSQQESSFWNFTCEVNLTKWGNRIAAFFWKPTRTDLLEPESTNPPVEGIHQMLQKVEDMENQYNEEEQSHSIAVMKANPIAVSSERSFKLNEEAVDIHGPNEDWELCCICKENVPNVTLSPCSHTFCFKCTLHLTAVHLKQQSTVPNCPLCRGPIVEVFVVEEKPKTLMDEEGDASVDRYQGTPKEATDRNISVGEYGLAPVIVTVTGQSFTPPSFDDSTYLTPPVSSQSGSPNRMVKQDDEKEDAYSRFRPQTSISTRKVSMMQHLSNVFSIFK